MADEKIKNTEVQITNIDTKPEDIEVEVEEITEYRYRNNDSVFLYDFAFIIPAKQNLKLLIF